MLMKRGSNVSPTFEKMLGCNAQHFALIIDPDAPPGLLKRKAKLYYDGVLFLFFYFICHIYPPFTRKRIVSLYFGRDARTRLGVAFFRGL